MNIALSAVIIFILLIPPIAFYISFYFGRFPKSGSRLSFLDGVLASAVISLFIHSFFLTIIQPDVRFDLLLKLLGGELKDVEKKINNKEFSVAIRQFSLYNFIVLIIFISLGRLSRHWVKVTGRNNIFKEFFRLNNKWYYFFNGLLNPKSDLDMVYIDVIVDTKEGTILYSGFLVDFVCDGEKLERICLRDIININLDFIRMG